jgi:hypothetical protein
VLTCVSSEICAQVLACSLYFPKPECPIDAFCIGDVYGEASSPPGRAEEVFIAEVLEAGGFDEHRIAEQLRKGQPVLRPCAQAAARASTSVPFARRIGLNGVASCVASSALGPAVTSCPRTHSRRTDERGGSRRPRRAACARPARREVSQSEAVCG